VVGNDVGGRPKGVWPEKKTKIPQVTKANTGPFVSIFNFCIE
jgi:hypothetical protein